MSDIFISYSRKDSEQAMQLAELLSSAGLSCWIDQRGIEAATSWSKEIVSAIDQCSVFVVLLSTSSIDSHNVIKEVSLASEKRKKILPLELDAVSLPEELQYQLAGIQRSPMTNVDAIIRALGKLGLEATHAPQPPKIAQDVDGRKSLMILPFEDLSPTGDNMWFADGIVNELIAALSNIKSLRVADQQSTKDYKRYQGTLPKYAHEMSIRYFIQGDVRKFGDQIKISTSLLDIETGDHLWQDSMKGTMQDIFDIQEKVAEKVVEGLKVHLDSGEKKKLTERGTESAEAYELYMKALEYFDRQTKEGLHHALQLITEAINLDPCFAHAHRFKAGALTALYRTYDRNTVHLDEAEQHAKEALRLKPDLFTVYHPLSQIYTHRGQLAQAEEMAREFTRRDPQNYLSHFALGFFLNSIGQSSSAIHSCEEAVRLKPDDLVSLWNLVVCCEIAGDQEKCGQWSQVLLPAIERRLKLHPDEEHNRVRQAILLELSGRIEEARAAAMKLRYLKDSVPLFNTACLFGKLGDKAEALRTLRRAIEAGFSHVSSLKGFLNDDKKGILSLQGTPEYEEVKLMVEKLEAQAGKQSTAQEASPNV